IADSALDYSRRTLADLLGSKYFPECYVPFTELERHFATFLRVPPPERWTATADRPRHVNGLLLVGLVGAGKTAFLARQVEALLRGGRAGREGEAPGGGGAPAEPAAPARGEGGSAGASPSRVASPSRAEDPAARENPNLVLFLRGNGVLPRPEGM